MGELIGRMASATGAMRTLVCIWLSVVVASELSNEGEVTSLDSMAQSAEAGPKAGGSWYCTPKGDNSPDYAYNDKNCEADGKVNQCGEVWCCPANNLYSCARAQRGHPRECKGKAPICSGPKPSGQSATSSAAKAKSSKAASGKTGCYDSHTAICAAAKEYGHCSKASYANQCMKSCGKCSMSAATKAMRKKSVARILAKVASKDAVKKLSKPSSKSAMKKAIKKAIKKEKKQVRKTVRKANRNKAKLKKEKKIVKKAKKIRKKKAKKIVKSAKKAVKKLQKKIAKEKKTIQKEEGKAGKPGGMRKCKKNVKAPAGSTDAANMCSTVKKEGHCNLVQYARYCLASCG